MLMVDTPVASSNMRVPYREVVTDTVAMRELLQRQLPGFAEGRLSMRSLTVMRIHHISATRCAVCYRAWVRDLQDGRRGLQIFYGVVEPPDVAQASYARARCDLHVAPRFGPSVHLVPELNMVVWGFPNDPALGQLRRLVDERALSELLGRHWGRFCQTPGVSLQNVRTKLVKYVPQNRCTLRHELSLDGADAQVIYSKTLHGTINGAAIFNTMQRLWDSAILRSGTIIFPQPLFYESEMNVLFVRGLEGVNVDDHLGELELDHTCAEIANGLAAIHQCQLDGLRDHSRRSPTDQLAKVQQVLESFDPAYSPRIDALAKELWEKHAGLTYLVPTPIHGAFRLSQCLLVDGRLAFIDFDDFALGNPVYDVASFIAYLLYLPLKDGLTPEQSRSAIRHFCQAYATQVPWGLPTDVLAWHTTVHLVAHHAKKCIRLAKKQQRSKVDQLLDMAEDLLVGTLSLM